MGEHFSGFQVDQAEANFFGTAAQTVDEPCAVEFQVSAGSRILVGEVTAQDPVDQYCKFAGGGGDSLGLAQPVSQAAIISSQCGRAAGQAHSGTAQTAAARLAEGWVLELSKRLPEILLLGASVSQPVKCFSVRQRLMSVPISAISCNAP